MPTVHIAELAESATEGFCPRGGAAEFWRCKDHELVLAGPAETGKTWSCCQKLDALLWKYPGAQAVMARKVSVSLYTTCYQTFQKITGFGLDGYRGPLVGYGGEKPEWISYPNGSRLFLAGLDNPQKALSSERDFFYANQLEEFDANDWEVMATRCTGRAANSPYPQMMADCNPGPPTHWILSRPSLRMFHSRHEDNPTLFDENGVITERGVRTLSILDRLTGVRYQRLRLGKWVAAEGVVYDEWDRGIHLLSNQQAEKYGLRGGVPPAEWRRIRAIDFGFSNPFVCHWWAIDPDGRMFLYREIYMSQRTCSTHARQIKALTGDENIEVTVADHDAEDRATLHENGVETTPAHKAILPGIDAVKARMKKAGDGKARLFILQGALVERDQNLLDARLPTCTYEEEELYAWPKTKEGQSGKEVPVDMHNHGMDAKRYAVACADNLGGGWAHSPEYWKWMHSL